MKNIFFLTEETLILRLYTKTMRLKIETDMTVIMGHFEILWAHRQSLREGRAWVCKADAVPLQQGGLLVNDSSPNWLKWIRFRGG